MTSVNMVPRAVEMLGHRMTYLLLSVVLHGLHGMGILHSIPPDAPSRRTPLNTSPQRPQYCTAPLGKGSLGR